MAISPAAAGVLFVRFPRIRGRTSRGRQRRTFWCQGQDSRVRGVRLCDWRDGPEPVPVKGLVERIPRQSWCRGSQSSSPLMFLVCCDLRYGVNLLKVLLRTAALVRTGTNVREHAIVSYDAASDILFPRGKPCEQTAVLPPSGMAVSTDLQKSSSRHGRPGRVKNESSEPHQRSRIGHGIFQHFRLRGTLSVPGIHLTTLTSQPPAAARQTSPWTSPGRARRSWLGDPGALSHADRLPAASSPPKTQPRQS